MVKKLTDPNAPKRPLSGYFMWMASGVRDKLLAENKGKRVAEVLKTCGDRWSKMPESEKKIWQNKSKREKDAWTKKMAAYKKTDSFKKFQKRKDEAKLMKVKSAKKPKDKNKNKPKRPLTGFFRFTNDFRKRHPDMKLTELTKAAGLAWKALDEAKRKKYLDAAASEQGKYQKELAKYKKSKEYKQYLEKLEAFKTNKQKKLKKFNNKLKKKNK